MAFDELFGSVYGRTTCLRGHLAKLRLLVGYEVGGLCKIVGVVLVFLRSLFKLVHAILILLKTVVVFFQPLIVFLHGRVVLAQHRLVPLLELFVYRSRGADPFHLVQHGCGLVEHGFGEFKLGASVIELLFGILDLLSGLIDFLLLLLTDARLSCFRLAGKKFDELVLVFLYAVAVIIRPIVEMFSIVVDDACDHRHLGVEFRRHGHGV